MTENQLCGKGRLSKYRMEKIQKILSCFQKSFISLFFLLFWMNVMAFEVRDGVEYGCYQDPKTAEFHAKVYGFEDKVGRAELKIQNEIIIWGGADASTRYRYIVNEISDHAFYYAENLETVFIPKTIVKFGSHCFKYGLKKLTLEHTTPPNTKIDADLVVVPKDCYLKYLENSLWSTANLAEEQNTPAKKAYTKNYIFTTFPRVIRWEKSVDDGNTWEKFNSNKNVYIEENPKTGKYLYRALNDSGTYTDIIQVTYYEELPSNIKTLPIINIHTVDEPITFLLDIEDRNYSYQWRKDKVDIKSATSKTYTIPNIKTSDAGTYDCIISNSYNTVTSISTTLTVNKSSQYINLPPIDVKTYGDSPFTLPQTTDKGLEITYQSLDERIAKIDRNIVTITGAGTTDIIASQGGNADYLSAESVSLRLTVNKIKQIIPFEALPEKTYGDGSFILPEKTDKGFTISYESTNTNVATIEGNIVNIKNAGKTEIVATQAGNAYHYAANPVTQILTVNKATQKVTFLPLPSVMAYNPRGRFTMNRCSDKGLEVTYISSNDVILVEGNILKINKVGTTEITAVQEGNDNYSAIVPIKQTVTVNKASQTIVWDNIPVRTFGDADFTLPLKTAEGLIICYTSDNEEVAVVKDNRISIKGAGTAHITASQTGNDLYDPAEEVTLPLVVAKAYNQINFAALPTCIYSVQKKITLHAESKTPVVFDCSNEQVASVDGNVLTINGAGECYVTARTESSKNYYDTPPIQRRLIVNKAELSVNLDFIEDKTYGDAPFTISSSTNEDFPVRYTTSDSKKLIITGNTATILGAGTVTVTATVMGNDNYETATATQTLVINKANLIVTAENKKRLYGEENPEFTVVYEGLVNGDSEESLSPTPLASTNATITSKVGNYSILPNEVITSNYNVLYRNGVLSINKAPLQVWTDNYTREYGQVNPYIKLLFSGFKNGEGAYSGTIEEMPVITTAESNDKVGVYDIVLSGGVSQNYSFEYQYGKLTITKAELHIIANDVIRKYGEENPKEFTARYIGFKNKEDESILTKRPLLFADADIKTIPGRYWIQVQGAEAENYSIIYNPGTLLIEKAPLVVKVDKKERCYGEENPNFTFSYEGTVNGDSEDRIWWNYPQISCNATPRSNVGTYDITISGGSSLCYDIEFQSGTLKINKALLEFIADDKEFRIGDDFPAFSYNIYGFKLDDTENDLDKLPKIYCEANEISPQGEYDIIIEGGYDNNYSFEYQNGTLTINAGTSINKVYTENSYFYFSPNRDRIYFSTDSLIMRVDIISIDGSIKYLEQDRGIREIPIDGLANGCYILRVWENEVGKCSLFKFIK